MKKIYFVSIILLVSIFVSCSFLSDSQNGNISNANTSNDNSPTNNSKIDSKYWGTWIQMDTGSEYYIDNQNIYIISSYGNKSEIQSGISGYYLESNEVLRNESTVFFRKGGKNRRFSATVSGFSPRAARGIGTGSQGISGRRENEENPADNETATSDEDGSINFDGGVADDPQIVTVVQGNESGSATITPKYDGENVGSIPVVESGKYAFKTTYTVSNADSQGFMYGNNMGLYEISFNLTNIGYETCATSVYTISWEDTNLFSQNFEKQGNFTSIKSGASKTITGSFSYGYFDEEYKDVTISIEITDSKYEKTWYDYVTLRFYRGWIDYKVKARNFNASSSAKLNGFLVYPDGRSKRFTVSSGNVTTVSIPWSTRDYYLVFSGANDETEMCYSFVASEFGSPADLSGVWSIADINAYENNDSINDAVYISNNEISTKAYLKNGDIDYFKFNVSNLTCSKGGLEYLEHRYSDSTSISSSNNNGDGTINPGESIWMDIAIYNSSKLQYSNVIVEVESDSEYITFDSEKTASYGNISVGYIKTYNNYKDNSYNTTLNSNDYYLSSSSYVPFKFTISKECPVGTVIPISIKMTEQNGYEWIDSFDITVVRNGVNLEYLEYSYSDSTSISSSNNNGDSNINPGESIWMDVAIKNSGTSLAQGVIVEVESDSEYITFDSEKTASYGNISVGYIKTYNNYKDNSYNTTLNSNDYYLSSSSYVPFKFTISKECPVGTVIPISIKMTEQNGYEWIDSFDLTVVKPNIILEYSSYKLSAVSNSVLREGESRNLDICIHNKGTSLSKNVNVSVFSDYPYIEFIRDSANYRDISAGYYKTYCQSINNSSSTGSYSLSNVSYSINSSSCVPFVFKATSSFVANNVIPITLIITDGYGNEFIETFNLNEN